MKYKKSENGSFIHNCLIARRKEEPEATLFEQLNKSGDMLASLNGYAIIPLEEYAKLTGIEYDKEAIIQADKDLNNEYNFSIQGSHSLAVMKGMKE